jgi:hypothetical protein
MLLPVTTMSTVMNNNKNSYDEGDVEELRERLSFVEY